MSTPGTAATRLFIGVDPGLRGAVASLTGDGRAATAREIPRAPALVGDSDWPDAKRIGLLLRRAVAAVGDPGRVVVVVEYAGSWAAPGHFANAMRSFGPAVWYGAAGATRVAIEFVAPSTWQAEMLPMEQIRREHPLHRGRQGDPIPETVNASKKANAMRRAAIKAASVREAKRLFPGVNLHATERSRVESDGLAEALLIAEWGRRRFFGGAVFSRVPA